MENSVPVQEARTSPSPIYRFGVFQVNLAARELRKHGVRVRLRGQPFCILSILLSKAGEVVTREEIRQQLWGSDTIVDFEHSLNSAVKKLRAVLGDTPENSRYIETIPRVGYRFVAPVENVESTRITTSAAGTSGKKPREALAKTWTLSREHWVLSLGILVGLIAAGAASFLWSHRWLRSQAAPRRFMLAVLPFENLTGDPEQEYFSDGLTEEMIAQLGRISPERMGVIARSSVMHYKHSQLQLEQIGRELGVEYALEGSVRRDSGKVRITAELVQMKDRSHVWSRQYDRDLSDLLTLQGEIAQEIADEIELTLGAPGANKQPGRRPKLATDYEAYDLYLRGQYFWNKRTQPGFEQAAEYFRKAADKNPNYARAYAGLAATYALQVTYNLLPANEFMSKARAAALRALQIDESLPEAHTALALITEDYDWDWQTAEKEYKRAIQLDSNYATAHQWYAEYLTWEGRFDEALAESEQARRLDPLSLIIATDYGAIYYFSRQYDRAIEQFHAVLEMDPGFPRAHVIVLAYTEKGMFAEALAEMEKWRRREPTAGPDVLAYVYGRSGQQKQAERELQVWEKFARQHHAPLTPAILAAYVAAGRKEEALSMLQRAYAEHDSLLTTIKVEPGFDPLRNDARFQDVLHRVGLAQ